MLSKANAPRTAGIYRRKDSSKASRGLKFAILAVVIVAPERDIPGRRANDWEIPSQKALFFLNLGLGNLGWLLARIRALTSSITPIRERLLKSLLALLSSKNPNMAVMVVAMAIVLSILRFSRQFLAIAIIFLSITISTARRVAKWSRMSKVRGTWALRRF